MKTELDKYIDQLETEIKFAEIEITVNENRTKSFWTGMKTAKEQIIEQLKLISDNI